MKKDILVIGAGAAGLMCAITAATRGRSVQIIEHTGTIANKVRISGGGRCNFTNLSLSSSNYVSANRHFCKSALSRFTPHDFLALIKKHGVRYEEKEKGRLFCSGRAGEIVHLLPLTVSPSAGSASGPAAGEALCPIRITVEEFASLLDAHDVVVVDVRDPAAYWRAHLPGALSIPAGLVDEYATLLRTSDLRVVIYGDDPVGDASLKATSALRRGGVTQAQALNGGFEAWVAAGRVVVTQPDQF